MNKTKKNNVYKTKNNVYKTKKITDKRKKNTLIDNVKIIKKIGSGVYGTVYLAIDTKGNQYAYKIEKIMPINVVKSLKSSYWRELDFVYKFANKYPNQFMHLHDTRIELNCKHQQKYTRQINVYKKKEYEQSNYCGINLWSIMDGTLEQLLKTNNFTIIELYDIFIQIVNIIYLMDSAGYKHGDFHNGNIAYVKSNKNTLNIMGHKIPTHGYIIKAIDYGSILHPTYPNWQTINILSSDLIGILFDFSINLYTKNDNNKIFINKKMWYWKTKWATNTIPLMQYNEKNELLSYLPDELINTNSGFINVLIDLLFKVLYYEKWQRRTLKDDTIVGVKPIYILPINTILYIVKNVYKPGKVLSYLIKERREIS